MKQAPADTANSVISPLRSRTHKSFQQSVMNSAYFFRTSMFGVPSMNPCNPQDLTSDTSVRVRINTGAFPGTIVNTQTNTATVFFYVDKKKSSCGNTMISKSTFPHFSKTSPSQPLPTTIESRANQVISRFLRIPYPRTHQTTLRVH